MRNVSYSYTISTLLVYCSFMKSCVFLYFVHVHNRAIPANLFNLGASHTLEVFYKKLSYKQLGLNHEEK